MQPQSATTPDWKLLGDLTEHFRTSLDVPPAVMSIIAEKIEDAISAASDRELSALSSDLMTLVRAAVLHAPKQAVDAALDAARAEASEKAAHLLGQLGFAQMLAAQAASRRAGDEFFDTISSNRFRPYAELLFETELRNVDIANQLDLKNETVSRSLHVLREQGITDFQKRGRDVFNFLTPAASAVVAALREQASEEIPEGRAADKEAPSAGMDLRKLASAQTAMHEIPRHLQERQTLASVDATELESV
jgi:CRP-like cAMP-binding protein